MRKYLLTENGNFYKANLHCHSNISDGALSVEELKAIYMEKGYSIIAYTDHNKLVSHQELNEENFLALKGYELDVTEEKDIDWSLRKTCHICFIALDKDNQIEIPNGRKYTAEYINQQMKEGREKGFFVTYNHPGWSLENYEQYSQYEGMNAFEMFNYGCIVEGYNDYNSKVYDDLLYQGKRIYCIGTDDNHNHYSPDSAQYDSFGAYVMIKSDDLEYRKITKALENGDFYTSMGPEIKELWFEDGKVHIETSCADRIVLNTGRRKAAAVFAEGDNAVTTAEFTIEQNDVFFRISVFDEKGRVAHTNAYFTDDLFEFFG